MRVRRRRLIDDLLDVSRIITGNLRLDLHPLNLAPIVDAALDALRPTADVKGIKLQTRFEPAQCLVKGDPNRLRQVIWNLLSNAIKFTQRGGSVNIDLTLCGVDCATDGQRYWRRNLTGVSAVRVRSFPAG